MSCGEFSYDNRETCTEKIASSCVPYTGVVNEVIEDNLPACKPNINDIFKALQEVIQTIKNKLGDNTNLTAECLTFNPNTVTQEQFNQLIITELCNIKTALEEFVPTIDPSTIRLAIDVLCLEDPDCTPPADYTIEELFIKLFTAYCNLLTRVVTIETQLNL